MKPALTALAVGLVGAISSPARAEPSLWDSARNPAARRAYDSLVAAERMRERAHSGLADPYTQRDFTLAATALIELAGGARLRDARLDYLLGELLLDPLLAVNRAREAQRLLRAALEAAPDSPLAARGLFNLAIASAKLSEPRAESQAYTRALEVEFDAEARATIFANRADSRMVQGDLQGSIADYRRAARLAQLPHSQALAQWGLGVALERDGDMPSALVAVSLASSIRLPTPPYPTPDVLDLPEVFFVPAYDVHYYRALGAMARARREGPPESREEALSVALTEWRAYIQHATVNRAPWLSHAELHARRCERDLRQIKSERPRSALPKKASAR